MGRQWQSCGLPVTVLWASCDNPMGRRWQSCGPLVTFPWAAGGNLVGRQWNYVYCLSSFLFYAVLFSCVIMLPRLIFVCYFCNLLVPFCSVEQ